MEDENAARGYLAIQGALRSAQHFNLLQVNESNGRSDAEIGDDEGYVIQVVADRGVTVRITAPRAAQVVGPRGDRLLLSLVRARHQADQIINGRDVALFEVFRAERLDGQRRRLQRS